MRRGRTSKVLLFFALFFLLAGLAAGCGGGDQSGNGSQDGGEPGGKKQQGGGAAKKNTPEVKTALGVIQKVNPRSIVLRPTSGEQAGKLEVFLVPKKVTITLNDKEAELSDLKKGQEAQINYAVIKERNRAREVTAFSGGAGPEGGEATS